MAKKIKQNPQHLNGFLFGELDYNLIRQFSGYAPFKKVYNRLWTAEVMVYNMKIQMRWELIEKA